MRQKISVSIRVNPWLKNKCIFSFSVTNSSALRPYNRSMIETNSVSAGLIFVNSSAMKFESSSRREPAQTSSPLRHERGEGQGEVSKLFSNSRREPAPSSSGGQGRAALPRRQADQQVSPAIFHLHDLMVGRASPRAESSSVFIRVHPWLKISAFSFSEFQLLPSRFPASRRPVRRNIGRIKLNQTKSNHFFRRPNPVLQQLL